MTDSKYFTTTKKGEGGLLRGAALGGGQGEVLPRAVGGGLTHTRGRGWAVLCGFGEPCGSFLAAVWACEWGSSSRAGWGGVLGSPRSAVDLLRISLLTPCLSCRGDL